MVPNYCTTAHSWIKPQVSTHFLDFTILEKLVAFKHCMYGGGGAHNKYKTGQILPFPTAFSHFAEWEILQQGPLHEMHLHQEMMLLTMCWYRHNGQQVWCTQWHDYSISMEQLRIRSLPDYHDITWATNCKGISDSELSLVCVSQCVCVCVSVCRMLWYFRLGCVYSVWFCLAFLSVRPDLRVKLRKRLDPPPPTLN